ncbi:hypothetical protein [Scytonema sp. NUACC21]
MNKAWIEYSQVTFDTTAPRLALGDTRSPHLCKLHRNCQVLMTGIDTTYLE